MNTLKLKIDLTNADQVAAMAAFFNTLNGTQVAAAPALTVAPEHKASTDKIVEKAKEFIEEVIRKEGVMSMG